MYKYICCLLLFFSPDMPVYAQAINGTVLSADNNETLPYVNIGIRNKNVGTISSIDGKFSITIPEKNKDDTLVFSMVGFEELKLPVPEAAKRDSSFVLQPRVSKMNEVKISSKKLVEKKYGLVKYKPILHFLDGSIKQDDIFEIAQLIKLGPSPSRIKTVSLHINEDRKDSGTFRINFYQYDGLRPAIRLVERSIVQTKEIKDGWLNFDVSAYKIYLSGDVVAAIEFIPTKGCSNKISYEIKPGAE